MERLRLHDLVVTKGSDAVLFYDGIHESRLDYDRLHQIADTIAASLNQLIGNDNRYLETVGIYMEMSSVAPACVLGILKAACCFVYLPQSESYSYLNRIIERANVRYLIADERLVARNTDSFAVVSTTSILDQLQIVQLATKGSNGYIPDDGNDCGEIPHDLLAYIMFSSGTTGESKMVRVPHSCIVPNILHLWNEYKVSRSDIIFLSSPLTFDPSIVDIFLALCSGATLLIVTDDIKRQPKKLANVLFNRYQISILQTTPTLLLRFPSTILKRILCPTMIDCTSLRILALGGEPFPCSALAPYICYDDAVVHWLRLYNLYGPTEVSCWSTCHRVKRDEIWDNAIPIGQPMLGTELRLMDKEGHLIHNNGVIGELWLGGGSRYCFVNNGQTVDETRFRIRPAGDLAVRRLDTGGIVQYYIIGRTDDQTKRMGKRLNLRQISQIIETNVNVKTCAVILDDDQLLRAFVLPHLSFDSQSFIAALRQATQGLLPHHCQPDMFHFIESMPITKHGKVDKRTLLNLTLVSNGLHLLAFSVDSIEDAVTTLLKNFIGDCQIEFGPRITFRQLGFDSLKTLAIAAHLELWTERNLPKAVEVMLTGTVADLMLYLASVAADKSKLDQQRVRMSTESALWSRPLKRQRLEPDRFRLLWTVEKCGRTRRIGEIENPSHVRLPLLGPLRLKWKWDSGKCIDASPVVVEDLTSGHAHVFIGSHSGLLACLDAKTGVVEWSIQLSDRIEASATITGCGYYVVVGCYDGGVYFLNRRTGQQWWKFQTDEAVKCTACVDGAGHVFIGSHDRRFYKLEYEEKRCVWSVGLGSAVLSTSVLSTDGNRVFVATLQGTMYCLAAECGAEIWSRQFHKPIFSSLVISDRSIIVASVDGKISWIAAGDGSVVRQFQADAPIFSTPTLVLPSSDGAVNCYLVFGCESGRIYCLREFDAVTLWTTDLGSAVSSSPFMFEGSVEGDIQLCICTITKAGTLHLLRLGNGEEYHNFEFGKEVFSSPVVFHDSIYVGCRDDRLYCLGME